jgi:hypothetical protein
MRKALSISAEFVHARFTGIEGRGGRGRGAGLAVVLALIAVVAVGTGTAAVADTAMGMGTATTWASSFSGQSAKAGAGVAGAAIEPAAWPGRQVGAPQQGTPTPTPGACAWNVVPSPNVGSDTNWLYGVAVAGPNDVWAVGYYRDATLNAYRTLVMRWNGAQWSVVPSPNVGNDDNSLQGVAIAGPNDVWAVGYYYDTSLLAPRTLILRWNGTSWSVVPSPNVGNLDNWLYGVAIAGPNDVWAVGYYRDPSLLAPRTLTLRWNGTSWSVVPSPNLGGDTNWLYAVAVAGPNDVWAVGYYYDTSRSAFSTLVERYICAGATPTATIPASSPTPTITPTPEPCSSNVVLSPNAGNDDNYLYGVAAAGPNDVWTVGYYYDTSRNVRSTLVLRWNGTSWGVVPSPNQGTNDNWLYAVAAGPNDVWAVGYYFDTSLFAPRTLVMRWNGTNWSVVPSPNVGNRDNWLYGVAVAGPNDVWAVGYYLDPSLNARTLVMRWNGTSWSVVPSPNVGNDDNYLRGVSVAGPNDVWAVGYYMDTSLGALRTLVLRWDGAQWSVVPSPNQGTNDNMLQGVAVAGPNDVWAVGYYYDTSLFTNRTLVLRWDGAQWSVVPSPNQGTSFNYLNGVAVAGPNDVWAVGYYMDTSLNARRTLALRWNGTSWSVVPSASVGNYDNWLYGVAVGGPGDVWAVGYYFDASLFAQRTLVDRYICVSITPTPTRTPSAPTPTPTPCTISFSDVPPNHTFYPFIRCLACRGIISGYADGTFRPGNPTTRGQMAKIIANAAGILDPIPPNRQTFSDVPPGHTFWVYIERLSARGIVGGYADGTFRPDNWVTRGQLTKFAANAAGFSEPIPPNQQTYTDVPPTHTFWEYVERLSGRGVISGYQCGVPPAGACDPQNRAWFLPDATVTRGQTSKIVANTFFPQCTPREAGLRSLIRTP